MKKKIHKDPFAEREANNYENPIASRELIADILKNSKGPMSHKALCGHLQLSSDEQIEALRRRLIAMERDGQLIKNRKGAYGLVDKMDLIRGRVQGHRDGFGFVIPLDANESSDIYLNNREMRKVFDGDEVLVRAEGEGPNGKREGAIVEILSHNTHQIVGRFVNDRGIYLVRPDNPRNSHDVLIPPEGISRAVDGQFVVVHIDQQPSRYQRPVGRIVEVLGDHMAPGMEIDVAIRSHGIPHIWPPEVQAQAALFTEEVKEKDKKGRIDLRKLPLVTIDGEDARDFDDAVYCESKKSGGWRLYVAIADVSHYVTVDSPLDKEAANRGTSVYFPDHVVPMLPHVLSNGLCSLNPQVDRLCMVCEMTISAKGKISGYTFYEAIMHSQARLTYTQVVKMIDERDNKKSEIRQQFKHILPHIDDLYEMYLVLKESRDERGAINFETKETRIIFDAERKIDRIVPIERNDAHKLIEECMLAANVCTAKLLESMKIPSLYRVHEGPREEKLENLYAFLGELGLSMKGGDEITPQHYRDILQQIEGRPDFHLIQTVMLRSMNQAVYQPANAGHFGLAYSAYAHFTSPIRRYPDLLVHRAIRALLQSSVKSSRLKRKKDISATPLEQVYKYSLSDMTAYGEQCSASERRADDATREVVSWLKCEYLSSRVGEEFNGVVSAVTGFGLFVELNDLYVEGLIHISSLPHDYYHFEAAQHRLVGEKTRKVFRLGDSMRVRVMRVDLDERKVDFELVTAAGDKKNTTRNNTSGARKRAGKSAKPARTVRKRSIASAEQDVRANKTQTKAKTAQGSTPSESDVPASVASDVGQKTRGSVKTKKTEDGKKVAGGAKKKGDKKKTVDKKNAKKKGEVKKKKKAKKQKKKSGDKLISPKTKK